MQELDIMLRRAKLRAAIYRAMAKRIAGMFAEQVICEEVAKLRELAGIHDPQQELLTPDDC